MVRLKVFGINDLRYITEFQFQNGSIKRELLFAFQYDVIHFNSKMVRLKVDIKDVLKDISSYFNSKMVRLKVFTKNKGTVFSCYFNSKMVRLKALPSTIFHQPLE